MQVVPLEERVQNPATLTTPPGKGGDEQYDGECWGCYFYVDPATHGGARYAIRATDIQGDKPVVWDLLRSIRLGPKHLGVPVGSQFLKPGDRVVVALGPENKIPKCTVYELRE